LLLVLIGLICGTAACAAPKHATPSPERLVVTPNEIMLASRRAYRQFVVTGYIHGEARDLTAEAVYQTSDSRVVRLDGSKARAAGNGHATITVRVGSRSQVVPASVALLPIEFGRTPRMNDRHGRDHWTFAFSFAFAGAGVPGGQVVGSTDRDGGYITSSMAYTIEDYAATIYAKLGIDRTKPITTPTNRPIYLAAKGRPIPELF
jgi:hypothetical protein